MGKKAKGFKSGDFIFAKVKGYPAWPARVQSLNGKKYLVYFYGTGETANLPPNMIFDYAENKDKFLNKAVKRRDFNEGVKQIEHDFANNVPLEDVIGSAQLVSMVANDTMDDSAIDTTAADDTVGDTTTASNATLNDTAVEDSDEAAALVIDEGKQGAKNRKSKVVEAVKTPKTPKTPRGKGRPAAAAAPAAGSKEGAKEDDEDSQEELVSRSGRKIRPKRYLDEQTEENATLPSPVSKKQRATSPAPQETKGEEKAASASAPARERQSGAKDKPAVKVETKEKLVQNYNNVSRAELDELKEPFKPADAEKENILIVYLPSGQYVGVKLFASRPTTFKDEATRLQWDKQSARNALQLATQLERGHITPQSVMTQLVMDLSLTDEEKATLDKERETEEKKSRVQFLKTEMKLIELDAKIKTCLCLERADTALCLQLLDRLMQLEVKPLMLLKHPTCLETVKRMRAYVGNTPSWDLTEDEALCFAKEAHKIRKQADVLYNNLKELFPAPEGLSFWEYFSARVLQFKQATAALPADLLLEMVHEPKEMSEPSPQTMAAAVEAAAKAENGTDGEPQTAALNDTPTKKKLGRPKKAANSTPVKQTPRRRNSKKQNEDKELNTAAEDNSTPTDKPAENNDDNTTANNDDNAEQKHQPENGKEQENNKGDSEAAKQTSEPVKDGESAAAESSEAKENEVNESREKETDNEVKEKKNEAKEKRDDGKHKKDDGKNKKDEVKEKKEEPKEKKEESKEKKDSEKTKDVSEKKDTDKSKRSSRAKKNSEREEENSEKSKEPSEKVTESSEKGDKTKESGEKVKESSHKGKQSSDKEKGSSENATESNENSKDHEQEKEDEPRAKRARGESKKTDPPPRSPGRNLPRKSKA